MTRPMWFLGALVTLVWLVVSLPFTDDSISSLFDISDSPPSSQEELWKLLQNITTAANFFIVSLFLLYGLSRGWYLRDGYPKWLQRFELQARFKKLFENRLVFTITNGLLLLLLLGSSILLWFHGRILGRGLGY